jgi:hypothetical protein
MDHSFGGTSSIKTASRKRLSAQFCVAQQQKMLTYDMYAPLFSRCKPCPEQGPFYRDVLWLNIV